MALDSYDKLFCSFDSTFTDDYGGKSLLTSGSPSIDTFIKKFGTGSAYLNSATSDYIYITDDSDFDLSNSEFTINGQYRIKSQVGLNNAYTLFSSWGVDGNLGYLATYQDIDGDKNICFYWTTNGSSFTLYSLICPYSLGTSDFYHISFARENGYVGIFVNGLNIGNRWIGTDNIYNSTESFKIGAHNNPTGFYYYGYVDDFRFSKGICRNTLRSFIPPTSQHTPDGFDVSVIHFDGSDGGTTFTDSTGNNTVTHYGNAVTKTSDGGVSPVLGTAMAKLDGTNDYFSMADSTQFSFGTDNFTIQSYVYFNGFNADNVVYDQRDSTYLGYAPILQVSDTDVGTFMFDTVELGRFRIDTDPLGLSTGQWYHICGLRIGEFMYFLINGYLIKRLECGLSSVYNSTGLVYISKNDVGTGDINGYMDEHLVARTDRYSIASFTPPTESEATVTRRLKYWNGSSWEAKPLKYWNGSSWVEKDLKHYDGGWTI